MAYWCVNKSSVYEKAAVFMAYGCVCKPSVRDIAVSDVNMRMSPYGISSAGMSYRWVTNSSIGCNLDTVSHGRVSKQSVGHDTLVKCVVALLRNRTHERIDWHWWSRLSLRYLVYRQTSNTRCTLVSNKIVCHSDVDGASLVGASPSASSFST